MATPSILNQLFGDKTFSNIDNAIDDIIQKIPKDVPPERSEETSGRLIDAIVSDSENENKKDTENSDELDNLFKNIQVPKERRSRYNLYDEIIKSVPLVSKVLKVYSSNIVQKNPINGNSIIQRKTGTDSDDEKNRVENSKSFSENFIKNFNFNKKLRASIIPKQLRYGDVYVEVVDINSEKASFSTKSENLLTESNQFFSELKNSNNGGTISDFETKLFRCANVLTEIQVVEDDSPPDEKNRNNDEQIDIDNFEEVVLKTHNPHNIINLQTKYGTTLGYLEVNENTHLNRYSMGFSQSLSGMTGKVVQMGREHGLNNDELVNKLIYFSLKKIIKNVKKQRPHDSSFSNEENVDEIVKSFDPEIYNFLKKAFIEQGLNKKNSKFKPVSTRFIPSNRMVCFSNPTSADYYPYSSSVVEDLILPGKLFMISQLSNVVTKLSRSSLIRKWNIDVGALRSPNNQLQKLKKEINNTRVSLDDMNSFKSIPKLFSDFKDMYVFSQNSRTPVDMSIEQSGDPNVKVQDLEFSERQIVSLSGIPSSFLGMNDTIELREQLVHANIAFCNEIINYQEEVNENINSIINIVAGIKGLSYNPSDYSRASLLPPTTLILQVIESTLSSVGNISGVFQNLKVDFDIDYFLSNYVPHIDWDRFKKEAEYSKTKDETKKDLGGGEDQGGGGRW